MEKSLGRVQHPSGSSSAVGRNNAEVQRMASWLRNVIPAYKGGKNVRGDQR